MGVRQRQRLFLVPLSEESTVETLILKRIVEVLPGNRGPTPAVDLSVVIRIDQLSYKVRREAHRMKGFIRFQQTANGTYMALIAPHYDLLPLMLRKRYYGAVAIRSRNNPALHRRQLPRRYWRYLTEKNPQGRAS